MTLAFSWASNLNYSTGPDLGTPTKVDPSSAANGFVSGVIAAPQHVNYLYSQIATQLLKAIDGVGGGTYTLSDDLEFDGSGEVRFAALRIPSGAVLNVDSTGIVDLNSGAQMTVDAGATIAVTGDVDIASGGDINVASGGDINVATGGDINVASGGEIRLDAASDLTLTSSAFSFRLGGTPVYAAAGWAPTINGDWDMTGASGEILPFELTLHPGDTLVSVSFRFSGAGIGNGGHGSPPGDRPSITLVRKDADGNVVTVGTQADASVGAAYDTTHTVTLVFGAGLHLVNTTDTYYVQLIAEGPTGGISNRTRVYGITGVGIARSFRGANELY